jgi:DNA repair protein RadC
MKIKDLAKVDRPREKLQKYGVDKMSRSELLAIVLRTGIKGKNVIELSKQVLSVITRLGIENITLKNLLEIKGLGPTKAGQIIASLELSKRLLKEKITDLIMSPKDVWQQMQDIRDHKREHFVVFYLDTRNQIIKREVISVGTLNASLIHPREVFEPAIRYSTAQIIIAHNHPSGVTDPSEIDKEVTKRLVEAGKLLGIEVLDHIIVTKTAYLSLRTQLLM